MVSIGWKLGFAGCSPAETGQTVAADEAAGGAPVFKVDPFWPKPLPNDWIIGEVAGVAEAAAVQDPPLAICCSPAPPVMEFDGEGDFVQGWGGTSEGYEWPAAEHGIFVDYKDNVWVAGNSPIDHQVLKFTRDGTFLLQIGQAGKTGGSNYTEYLGRPADIHVDPEAISIRATVLILVFPLGALLFCVEELLSRR